MLGFPEWSWSIAAGLPHRGTTGLLDAGAAVGALECDDKTPYHRGEHAYDDGLTKVPPAPSAAMGSATATACMRASRQPARKMLALDDTQACHLAGLVASDA